MSKKSWSIIFLLSPASLQDRSEKVGSRKESEKDKGGQPQERRASGLPRASATFPRWVRGLRTLETVGTGIVGGGNDSGAAAAHVRAPGDSPPWGMKAWVRPKEWKQVRAYGWPESSERDRRKSVYPVYNRRGGKLSRRLGASERESERGYVSGGEAKGVIGRSEQCGRASAGADKKWGLPWELPGRGAELQSCRGDSKRGSGSVFRTSREPYDCPDLDSCIVWVREWLLCACVTVRVWLLFFFLLFYPSFSVVLQARIYFMHPGMRKSSMKLCATTTRRVLMQFTDALQPLWAFNSLENLDWDKVSNKGKANTFFVYCNGKIWSGRLCFFFAMLSLETDEGDASGEDRNWVKRLQHAAFKHDRHLTLSTYAHGLLCTLPFATRSGYFTRHAPLWEILLGH